MTTPPRPPPSARGLLSALLLGLLAVPLAELATFVAVALLVGFAPAALAMVAISAAGLLLLRRSGARPLGRIRLAEHGPAIAGFTLDDAAAARLLAAILLIIPGFITGLLGLLVLLPATRRRLADWLRRAVGAAGPGTPADPAIVDLPPEDWRSVPEPRLERRDEPPPR